MRILLSAAVLGALGAALLPSHDAKAWWDRWHRWHYGVFVAPRVVVAPGYYAAPYPYYRPYAHWVPAHYDRWGRFIPGHWI